MKGNGGVRRKPQSTLVTRMVMTTITMIPATKQPRPRVMSGSSPQLVLAQRHCTSPNLSMDAEFNPL